MPNFIDLHMHSAMSDGTDTPELLVRKAYLAGMKVIALTDHDTIAGLSQIRAAFPEDMVIIPGVEFSCVARSGKCHILAYNFNPYHKDFLGLLDACANRRQSKLIQRIDWLASKGMQLTPEEIHHLMTLPRAGNPHIAQRMVAHGWASTIAEAIDEILNKCPITLNHTSAQVAIQCIKKARGTAIWAHPLGGTNQKLLDQEDFTLLLRELMDCGIDGLECFYSRYSDADRQRLTRAAYENHLLMSAGSDYHGTTKSVVMGQLSSDGYTVSLSDVTILQRIVRTLPKNSSEKLRKLLTNQ